MLPANHEMTFVCFCIVKVECQMLIIIGYFFSIFYMPMHGLLKRKRMQEQQRAKRIKMLYILLQACILGDLEMYLEGNSPHQTVMIVCELK